MEAAVPLVHVVPSQEMEALAIQVLPLALERRQMHDYPPVINLLCHIGERGGDKVKDMIADRLLVSGQTPYLVGQLAAQFGRKFLTAEQLAKSVEQVSRNIRLQVQRLQPDQEPETIPAIVRRRSGLKEWKP